MKLEEYNQVIKAIEKFRNADDYEQKLMKQFPEIKQATLCNIFSQSMQKRVRRTYHKLTHPETVVNIYERYLNAVESGESPGIILRLAKEYSFSSAMMAKIILEHQLIIVAKSEGVSGVTKSQVNKLLRDTSLIQDRDLSYEVYLCLLSDDVYGPYADSIKHSLGHEYEYFLRSKLEELQIGYFDEEDLRSRGYDKTPDIKLELPLAVDGKPINWIESKASFGDEDSHRNYLKDQFWSYWNRFGPGLVIYWFGFIEEIDEHSEKGILIRDHFPSNLMMMDPSMVQTKSSVPKISSTQSVVSPSVKLDKTSASQSNHFYSELHEGSCSVDAISKALAETTLTNIT